MTLSKRQVDLLGVAFGLAWAGLSIILGAEIARLGYVQAGHWVQAIGILLAAGICFAASWFVASLPSGSAPTPAPLPTE